MADSVMTACFDALGEYETGNSDAKRGKERASEGLKILLGIFEERSLTDAARELILKQYVARTYGEGQGLAIQLKPNGSLVGSSLQSENDIGDEEALKKKHKERAGLFRKRVSRLRQVIAKYGQEEEELAAKRKREVAELLGEEKEARKRARQAKEAEFAEKKLQRQAQATASKRALEEQARIDREMEKLVEEKQEFENQYAGGMAKEVELKADEVILAKELAEIMEDQALCQDDDEGEEEPQQEQEQQEQQEPMPDLEATDAADNSDNSQTAPEGGQTPDDDQDPDREGGYTSEGTALSYQ